MQHKILVIEDEPELLTLLRDNLVFEQYEVLCAETGEAGLELAAQQSPDLVLLDVMLPGISGYEVCQRLRSQRLSAPIIMLTARNAEADRIAGLDLGANDYVGKPFSVRELMARVRAHLRHVASPDRAPQQFTCGNLLIDLRTRSAQRNGSRFRLSPHEFDLLLYFVRHPGEIVSRQELLSHVWGYSAEATSRTVDNFVAKLRRKIELDPDDPRLIVTVHRGGYEFVLPEAPR